ncbi:hypothetical protein [Snodgrassella alvi]|nr:hypothetical protein [Snodgrassella alvi]
MTEAERAETRKQIDKEAARHIGETSITLRDGRKITCLTYRDGYAGGLSCDWHNTPQPK